MPCAVTPYSVNFYGAFVLLKHLPAHGLDNLALAARNLHLRGAEDARCFALRFIFEKAQVDEAPVLRGKRVQLSLIHI